MVPDSKSERERKIEDMDLISQLEVVYDKLREHDKAIEKLKQKVESFVREG